MVDVDAFDGGGRQPVAASSYLVALLPVLHHLLSSLWTARNLGAWGVQPLGTSPNHPQIEHESAICAVMGGWLGGMAPPCRVMDRRPSLALAATR